MNLRRGGILLALLLTLLASLLLVPRGEPERSATPSRPRGGAAGEHVPFARGGGAAGERSGPADLTAVRPGEEAFPDTHGQPGELLVEVRRTDGSRVLGAEVLAAGDSKTTDEEGFAHFRHVKPAPKVTVHVTGPDFYDVPASGSIGVSAGSRSEIRLILRRGGAIRGRVLDGRGRLLNREFRAAVSRSPYLFFPAAGERFGPGGRFELRGIRPGTVYVKAGAEGCVSALSDPVEVRPGRTTEGVTITLVPGGRITGLLVRKDTSAPFPGARISAFLGRSTANDVSDRDGRFLLSGLKPGPVSLWIYAPGWARIARTRVPVVAGEVTDLGTIGMGVGGAVSGTLSRPDGGSPRELNLSIHRRLPGVPLAEAPEEWVGLDAQGVFRRTDLEEGDWVLRVSDRSGRVLSETDVVIVEGEERRVDLKVTEPAGTGGSRIEGTVADPDGSPADTGHVWLLKDGKLTLRSLLANGRFAFGNVEPGTYRLVAYSQSGEGWSGPVEVVAGRAAGNVPIRLLPYLLITLRALHRSGNPAVGVYLSFRSDSGLQRFCYSGRNGESKMKLVAGRYEVFLGMQPAPGAKALAALVIEAGGERSFDVTID